MRGLLTVMLAVSVAGQTGSQTIPELAQATPELSTLVAALQAGNLVTTLNGTGPFTVFAPTNDAFNALPSGLVASLLQPANEELLVQLLTYHVANGAVASTSITNGQSITTLEGDNVTATLPAGGGVMINDATVTTADVFASNGVVHIVDKVLVPPGFNKTIVDLAVATPDLSTLVAAVTAADLVGTLSGPGPFTVFAPTNAAFEALPKGLVTSLLKPENKDMLVQLLTYHVAAECVLAGDITNNQSIPTVEGSMIVATLPSGGGVLINDANVTTADVVAANGTVAFNGVVHIIDKVLAPPGFGKTIVDLAVATPDLSTLVAAVQAGDLVSTLSGPGPFTVFAPTNAAFDALPKGLVAALLKPENKDTLVQLLTYHVAAGATLSSEITNNMQIPTVEGSNLVATLPAGGGVLINDATVTSADVVAANGVAAFNGVVHIIDKVLVPPGFNKTIVDLAVATPDLSTLVAAVTAADLVSTLSGPGPFTVFAPTDGAFNALPKGLVTSLLLPANRDLLVQLLTYHVAAGATLSSEITNNMNIPTVEGSNIVATLPAGGGVLINDATVTAADVIASNGTVAFNGVVHIIDKVLVPPGFAKTIVDLAVATPDLSTLVAAVTAADLVSTLSGPGPFTVFAPTNAAFAALPAGLVASLLKAENKALLAQLLTYHVAAGATLSSEITNNMTITTVEGSNIVATLLAGGGVLINDATVTAADVIASNGTVAFNGVLHIIDKVLVPPGFSKTIVDLAVATPDLSTLVAAVTAADLVDTLSGAGPFTVFAPTNGAFAALPAGLVASLLKPENKDMLVQLLTYHVAAGATLAGDLANNQSIPTVEGSNVVVTLPPGGGVMINDATVTLADVVAANGAAAFNGVVHILDKVLVPPGTGFDNKTIVDLAEATPTLSTLVAAVVAADLVSTLSGPGPFTVFAPSNAAFDALPNGTLASLLEPENKAQLVDLLTYHVVSGAVLASSITNNQKIQTVEGKNVVATVTAGGEVLINDATVTSADVVASNGTAAFNGVVHIIDKVLSPDSAPESDDDSPSLSGGAIAGVVAGSVVGVAAIGLVAYKVMGGGSSGYRQIPAGDEA